MILYYCAIPSHLVPIKSTDRRVLLQESLHNSIEDLHLYIRRIYISLACAFLLNIDNINVVAFYRFRILAHNNRSLMAGKSLKCNSLDGLSRIQRPLCRRYNDHMTFVLSGAHVGLQECKYQMKMNRWNCTLPLTTSPGKALHVGESLAFSTRIDRLYGCWNSVYTFWLFEIVRK